MIKSINILNHTIRVSNNNGRCWPISDDLIASVGGQGLDIARLYKLACSLNPKDVIKWVAYELDVTKPIALQVLLRFFLVDLGIRFKYGTDMEYNLVCMNFNIAVLGSLFDTFYSEDNIIKMINALGFDINLGNIQKNA